MRNLMLIVLIAMPLVGACKPQGQATADSVAESPSASSSASDGKQSEMALKGGDRNSDSDLDAKRDKNARKGMPEGISDEYYECVKRGGYRFDESMACLSDEKNRQDARLNELYQALLVKLDGKRRSHLVNAQKAWLGSRSHDESVDFDLYGHEQVDDGSIELNDVDRLHKRGDQLAKWLKLLDG